MQGCILDCAEMMNIVLKKGSWYSYGDHRYCLKTLGCLIFIHLIISLIILLCVLHPPALGFAKENLVELLQN